MTFSSSKFGKLSVGDSENVQSIYGYKDTTTDLLATIMTSAFFNDFIDQLKVNDLIRLNGTDDSAWAKVTSVTTNVTVTETEIAVIADGSVTKAKLATGVQPSHMAVYAAQVTTTGGAAIEAIAVTGVLVTDLVFAQVKTQGAAPQTILSAAATADTVTLTFSADPSNDHVIYYQVVRATS